MAYPYAQDRKALLARLRRIEGQIRGIHRMVEQDEYCVDILTQIQAAVSGLERVGAHLLAEHIRGCVRDAVASGSGEEKIAELVGVVERFMRALPSAGTRNPAGGGTRTPNPAGTAATE